MTHEENTYFIAEILIRERALRAQKSFTYSRLKQDKTCRRETVEVL